MERTAVDGIRVNSYEPDTPAAVNNVVRGNFVRSVGVDGISIATDGPGTVTGTVVQDNVVVGSGDDGIDVASPSTMVRGNVAVRNGDLGIEAVSGVTDGGSNLAYANGNPLQCTNIQCSGGRAGR